MKKFIVIVLVLLLTSGCAVAEVGATVPKGNIETQVEEVDVGIDNNKETTTPEVEETIISPEDGKPKEDKETEEVINEDIKETEPITFSNEYIVSDDYMPYLLFTPSSAENEEDIPLIVWLHGSGERNVGEDQFKRVGFVKEMMNWSLDGFNAYVVCPQLKGKWNTSTWNNETALNYLDSLVNHLKACYNINTKKIYIAGHSLGAQGALYMASKRPTVYAACVPLSGYNPGVDISNIKIPTIGYVGAVSAGEDSSSVSYMNSYFAKQFGNDALRTIVTSHGNLPKDAFIEDENNDNKSDLIEWMLSQKRITPLRKPFRPGNRIVY